MNALRTAGRMFNRPKQKQRPKSDFSRRTFPEQLQILRSFSSFEDLAFLPDSLVGRLGGTNPNTPR